MRQGEPPVPTATESQGAADDLVRRIVFDASKRRAKGDDDSYSHDQGSVAVNSGGDDDPLGLEFVPE